MITAKKQQQQTNQNNMDLDFSIKSKYALFTINKRRGTSYNFVKPKQIECVKSALSGDTLIVLPTGYGKSLIYELVQQLCKSKIFIISPINAIINEQLQRLGSTAIRIDQSVVKEIQSNSGSSKNKLTNCDAKFILGHPEDLTNKTVCDIFSSSTWKDVSHIFVDEVHCIVSWGSDFRPAFKCISKLRSIFPKAIMIGMTATATLNMQSEIKEKLFMNNTTIVSCNPNRENIKLTVKRRKATVGGKENVDDVYSDLIMPFVTELIDKKEYFPKTIIYSNLKLCGLGYDIVLREASKQTDRETIRTYVSQYHSPSTEEKKKRVTEDMRASDGHVRLLFATEAYGMGVDAPDVRRIIHVGPPNSLETYLQEIGRAGRDGQQSEAVLYFNSSDIGDNRKHLKCEMKEFCTKETCRRNFLGEHFGYSSNSTDMTMHNCCDICEGKCNCDLCIENLISIVDMSGDSVDKSETEKNIKNQCNELTVCITNALSSYFDTENISGGAVFTGLSRNVLTEILDKFIDIELTSNSITEQEMKSVFPLLKREYISNIVQIIVSIKSSFK